MGSCVSTASRALIVPSDASERRRPKAGIKDEALADILERSSSGSYSRDRAVPLLMVARNRVRKLDRGAPSVTLLVDNSTLASDVIKILRSHEGEIVYCDVVSEPVFLKRYSISNSFSLYNDGKPMSTMEKNRALAVAGLPPM